MLLEIPNVSSNDMYLERNIICRPFRKMIDSSDNNLFNGPPEIPRDYLINSARSLYHGDWKTSVEYLFGATKMWKLVPEFESVKEVLTEKIKEVGLKVLILRCSKFYDNYSITDLSTLFELEESKVIKLISKLIIRDGINLTIREKEKIIDIRGHTYSKLQNTTAVLTEKMETFIKKSL